MSRPDIPNLRTWPRNLSTSQYGGLSTSQYGGTSTSQYGGASTSQYGGLSTSQYGGMSTSQYGGLSTTNMGDFQLLSVAVYLRPREGECLLPQQTSTEVIFRRGLIS